MEPNPLIAIVGQTASGKTALAIEIAKIYDGEVICADSRTVYKGMDIGTAKPTTREQQGIKHHLVDVVAPDQKFSAADFKNLATNAIQDITNRGKLPILAGGSGLFIDGVLYDFSFQTNPDVKLRSMLADKTIEELQHMIKQQNLAMPENARNKRYLVRAIERGGKTGSKKPLRKDTLIIGLRIPKDELEQKLHQRVEQMLTEGLIKEVDTLANTYGWDLPALQTPVMKAFKKYIQNKITLTEAKELVVRGDLQLAKRQLTWFKRNPDIIWVHSIDEALQLSNQFMSKYLLQ